MRVLHVYNRQLRRYGKTHVSWAQTLNGGLIRNDHYVQVFSDRDVAAFLTKPPAMPGGHPDTLQRMLDGTIGLYSALPDGRR